jgi:hypothetical protein
MDRTAAELRARLGDISLDGLQRVLRMSEEAGRPDAVEVVRAELARRVVVADPGPVLAIEKVTRSKSATRARKVPERKAPSPLPFQNGDEGNRLANLFADLLEALTDGLTDL